MVLGLLGTFVWKGIPRWAAGLSIVTFLIVGMKTASDPFENIMMAAVQLGGDRQELHEVIRTHSMAAAHRVKAEGADNDLLDRLRGDDAFSGVDLDNVLEPSKYVGRAPEQVDAFLAEVVAPIRERYAAALSYDPALKV